MRITSATLRAFVQHVGDAYGYRHTVGTADRKRPEYVMKDRTLYSSRHALAYLFGRYVSLRGEGEVSPLPDKWEQTLREVHDSDPDKWNEHVQYGKESVTSDARTG